MSLLTVDNLSIAFGENPRVVRGVSFAMQPGETLALVGESGSGKSLTALSILQLLPRTARTATGSITIDGRQVIGASDATLQTIRGNRVGMIFQEPMTSLNPLHTVGRQVGEAVSLHQKLSPAAVRARVIELFTHVALPNPEHKLKAYPHELSGGQRQRVMIAMAIANNPALLIADEPTTALDVTVQAQILALLKDLQQRLGMALLLITHDLHIVRRVADRVCVMQHGQIVEQASAADLFARPAHPYTQLLLNASPRGEAEPVAADARILLQADDIKVHFPVRRGMFNRTRTVIKAVDGVSLSVRAGETLGIVGESGSGKTTLGLALLRLIKAEGRAVFLGQDVFGLSRRALRQLRRSLQVVFQDPFASLSPRMSAGDIVAEGLDLNRMCATRAEREQRIIAALTEVGLDPASRNRYPHEFSGGQRQRLSIARAIIMKPKLIVLDEPTSALDMSVQGQIVELLRDLQRRHGLAFIFISHDLRVIRAMAHRVLVLKNGVAVETGPASQIFTAPQQDYTRALLKAALLD